MKKIVIISTSLRKSSNSERLAREFDKGATAAGNDVEFISLIGKDIGFCKGCLACQTTGECVIRDDAVAIAEAIRRADVVVFATPIYYYGLSGQLKTLLDRCNPLFPGEYAFREIHLLTTAADTQESAIDGAVTGLQGWVDCFEKATISGVLRGVGVNDPGEAASHPALLKKAYDMGFCV